MIGTSRECPIDLTLILEEDDDEMMNEIINEQDLLVNVGNMEGSFDFSMETDVESGTESGTESCSEIDMDVETITDMGLKLNTDMDMDMDSDIGMDLELGISTENTPPNSPNRSYAHVDESVTPAKRPIHSNRVPISPDVRKIYSMAIKRDHLGGNTISGSIYGELTVGSMQKVVNKMVDKCGLTHQSRVIDIGSGLGRPNLHFSQDPGCRLSVGVEVERTRWQLSQFILNGVVSQSSEHEFGSMNMGVNFIHMDICDAHTTDPFTHIYMYDVTFPCDIERALAVKFNNSIHATHLVCYHPPYRVIDEFEYDVTFVDKINTQMSGSGEHHMAYFYKRCDRTADSQHLNLNNHSIIEIKKRSRDDESTKHVVCDDAFRSGIEIALSDQCTLKETTQRIVHEMVNAKRPVRMSTRTNTSTESDVEDEDENILNV